LKHLNESHADFNLIESLKQEIDKVVDAINEGKRTVEIQEKVVRYSQCFENLDFDLVTPTRLYVRHSDCLLRHSLSGTGERRTLFLFNDLIIVARETSSKPTFQIKTKMPFAQSRFIVLSEQEKISNAFELLFEDKRFIFCMSSKSLQGEWIADLRALTREFKLAQIRAAKGRVGSQRSN
jgi:SOS1/NGEF-like PH domain